MEPYLLPYFTAEKQEALLFMAVGAAAVALSAWLWTTGSPYKGMAVPLVAIAAIQFTVGGTVYFRTDAQVAALQAQQAEAPATFKAEETARMQVVIANFRIYKWIEIALLATGIVMTFVLRGNDFGYAAGIGLILQSALMLVLDLFAEHRADRYYAWVQGVVA